MANGQIVTLTPAARARMYHLVTRGASPAHGVRMGLKKGGCAGMEYTLDLVRSPCAGCDLVEQDGIRLYVDKTAFLFLFGTEIDYKSGKLGSGFVFNNPNQLSACGCGESVMLERADLSARLGR